MAARRGARYQGASDQDALVTEMKQKQQQDMDFAQALVLGLAFSAAVWGVVVVSVFELF